MSEPWTGAWRWVSDRMDGRPTITSTHYCYLAVRKDRVPAVSSPLSDSDAADLFRGIGGAGGGTLDTTVKGDEWSQVNTNFVGLYPKDASSTVLRSVQVTGDDMAQQVMAPNDEVLANHHYVRISDAGTSDLSGAWELREGGWTGIAVFTDSQYQYLATKEDRPIGANADSPDAELAELYHATFAQAGAYRVADDVLLATPEFSKNPAEEGETTSLPFQLDGPNLELEVSGRIMKFQKVD